MAKNSFIIAMMKKKESNFQVEQGVESQNNSLRHDKARVHHASISK